MKKLLIILLVLCLSPLNALAGFGTEPELYVADVVDNQFQTKYADFYKSGRFSITIPGLNQDFVPQGMAYYASDNLMFFTGYSTHHSSSMLVAVDMKTNKVVKEIYLCLPDGIYTGHAGGVCVTDKNIFVSDNGHLYRLPMSDFHAADPLDALSFIEEIPVPCKASYCQIDNGILWVGEFYESSNSDFHTDPSHHYKTKRDGTYHSWLLGYKLVDYAENELNPACMTANGAEPDYILSTTDNIQGVTVCDGRIYLSRSYGRKKASTLYCYKNVLETAPDKQVNVLGVQRPMWFLDSKAEVGTLKCPPMSENLCTINGEVYMSFESASLNYREGTDGKGTSEHPVDRVYVLNPNAF